MSNIKQTPFHLRPNKALDRELFLSLLTYMTSRLILKDYEYIGLGGPFLEDFRLIHARIGISRMVSVDNNEFTVKRQEFNRPFHGVECIKHDIIEYIKKREFDNKVVLWLDFSQPNNLDEQISCFTSLISRLRSYCILRITLNASPANLDSSADKSKIETEDERSERRLASLKKTLGRIVPNGIDLNDVKTAKYGRTLLKSIQIAVEGEAILTDKNIVWALSNHYNDGQPMITSTLMRPLHNWLLSA